MSHYRNGVEREYQARDALTAAGWEVIRSAGSKGAADLIAGRRRELGPDVIRISIWEPDYITERVVVQVKRSGTGAISPAERVRLQGTALVFGAVPVVVYQPAPRKPLAWRELTGPGPKDWQPWTPDEVAG